MDVHRDFCEVAIVEAGEVRSAGRIETTPATLELFAQSLCASDRVVLEVTGNAWEIARMLEPHVGEVLVVHPGDTGIRQARAKTDRLMLARSRSCWPPARWTGCGCPTSGRGRCGGGWPTHGRISKQGSASARHALVEAAWSVVRQPGPLHAFYQRIRARRGHQVAVVAAARKLACLFWCMLTRGQDYAYAQPSLTKKKLRRLELAAGAPRYRGARSVWSTNDAMRRAERELARQAELAYQRTVADWQSTKGASATPGRASQRPSKGKQRGKASVPNPAL